MPEDEPSSSPSPERGHFPPLELVIPPDYPAHWREFIVNFHLVARAMSQACHAWNNMHTGNLFTLWLHPGGTKGGGAGGTPGGGFGGTTGGRAGGAPICKASEGAVGTASGKSGSTQIGKTSEGVGGTTIGKGNGGAGGISEASFKVAGAPTVSKTQTFRSTPYVFPKDIHCTPNKKDGA